MRSASKDRLGSTRSNTSRGGPALSQGPKPRADVPSSPVQDEKHFLCSAVDWKCCFPWPASSFCSLVLGLLPVGLRSGIVCFVRWAKGKRAQLYNALGFWWSARLLWHAVASPPSQSFLLGAGVRYPDLGCSSPPSQVSNRARWEQALTEITDRLLHPTHRAPGLLLLPQLQRL